MNLANKITLSRIILTVILSVILLFPFSSAGIDFPNLFVNELIVVDVKYLIVGVIFIIALITDYLDGYIARKYKIETEMGAMLDNVADKMLIDSVLIILASQGFLHAVIPVVVIGRDCAVNVMNVAAIKRGKKLKSVKTGKAKNITLELGLALTLFYNLPFEVFNLNVSDMLLIVGTVLAVISGMQYYNDNKKSIGI